MSISKPKKIPTPQRIKSVIKHDVIHPADYLKYDSRFSCEDCTHFDSQNSICTIGYKTFWHLAKTQRQSYELSGTIAHCRFLEID